MIDDEGVIELSKSNWKSLSFLHLSNNQFSNRGIKVMLSNFYWINLKNLELDIDLNTVLALRYTAKIYWELTFRCQYDFNSFGHDRSAYREAKK